MSFFVIEVLFLNEKVSGLLKMESLIGLKRYLDEMKEIKMFSVLRKKLGFLGFMNSLVGLLKKLLILVLENLVYVIYVGYDSMMG